VQAEATGGGIRLYGILRCGGEAERAFVMQLNARRLVGEDGIYNAPPMLGVSLGLTRQRKYLG
jgi:hypothetical protein